MKLTVDSRELFNLWNLQVFVRNRHQSLTDLLTTRFFWRGIYLIACDDEIVYVGQTNDLMRRPLQSLGKSYHQVSDTSLQWGIAYAPCEREDMDEQESTAIRAFGPRFNTSIPSEAKSQGQLPRIAAVATVFQHPDEPCSAFQPENLRRQMERAAADPKPIWKRKTPRRPTERRVIDRTWMHEPPRPLSDERRADLMRSYGVPADELLVYPVNLCDDGYVVTKDGEVLGTWSVDDHSNPFFTPEGHTEPLFSHVTSGGLAFQIRDWYEAMEAGSSG